MSFNKVIDKINKKKRNKSQNNLESIKSHISSDEIDTNSAIRHIIKKIKKIKLNVLTKSKPKLTPIKDIKDEKEIKLIKKINSFRNIFYDYNLNQKVPKNNEPKVYTGHKNYNFSNLYKNEKIKNNLEQNKMLEDIQGMYKNNNSFSLPTIDQDKNLFNGNLLLLNESNIKNYIEFKLTSEKSNKNSLLYLKKIQKYINNQLVGKRDGFPKLSVKKNKKENKEKDISMDKLIKDDIPKSKNEINNIMEVINCMNDLDYFFESNNQEYLNYLKDPESKKNSKISTRVNSALWEIPKINNNIDIFKLKLKKNNHNNLETYKKNKSCEDISKKIINVNNKNNIDIYNINYKEKMVNKNKSIDNIKDKKNNLIKIKRLYLNCKINPLNIKSIKNIHDLKIQINEKIMPKKKILKNLQNQDLDNKIINLTPNNDLRAEMPSSQKKDRNLFNTKSTLEKLYDKIKKTDESPESNILIKNYLEKKKYYNFEPKIDPIDICNNYQNARENILRNDYFKKYIRLKKTSGFDESTYDNIKNEYDNSLKKLNSMAENINKVISNL